MIKLSELRSQIPVVEVIRDQLEADEVRKNYDEYRKKVFDLFIDKADFEIESFEDAEDLVWALHFNRKGNARYYRTTEIFKSYYAEKLFKKGLSIFLEYYESSHEMERLLDSNSFELATRLIYYMPRLLKEHMTQIEQMALHLKNYDADRGYDAVIQSSHFIYHAYGSSGGMGAAESMLMGQDVELYREIFKYNGGIKAKKELDFPYTEIINSSESFKDYIEVFKSFIANSKEYYIKLGTEKGNEIECICDYFDFNIEEKKLFIAAWLDAVGFGDKVDPKRIEAALKLSPDGLEASKMIYTDVMGVATNQSLDLPGGLLD